MDCDVNYLVLWAALGTVVSVFGWVNHLGVVMWQGHDAALAGYPV